MSNRPGNFNRAKTTHACAAELTDLTPFLTEHVIAGHRTEVVRTMQRWFATAYPTILNPAALTKVDRIKAAFDPSTIDLTSL